MAELLKTGAASYDRGKQLEITLGAERTEQMKSMLLQGISVREVCNTIQREWELFTHLKPASVQTMVYRYSRKVVTKDAVDRVVQTVTKSGHIAVTTLLDLTDLCKTQKGRVERAMATEVKMGGILTDMATKQIALYSNMLKDLAVLQMETGVLPRAPKTVKGMMLGEGGPIHFGWVESDENLLAALKSEVQSVHEPT